MAIKIVEGNLLDAKEDLILHQVNCKGKMNSGVAKQIREKWNGVYDNYVKLCNNHSSRNLLGYAQFVNVNKEQYVVNLFSQLLYGYDGQRYTNYEALYRALEKVSIKAREFNLSIALPYRIGCDRGGANWNIVYTMIEELFKDVDVTIYKYKGR